MRRVYVLFAIIFLISGNFTAEAKKRKIRRTPQVRSHRTIKVEDDIAALRVEKRFIDGQLALVFQLPADSTYKGPVGRFVFPAKAGEQYPSEPIDLAKGIRGIKEIILAPKYFVFKAQFDPGKWTQVADGIFRLFLTSPAASKITSWVDCTKNICPELVIPSSSTATTKRKEDNAQP